MTVPRVGLTFPPMLPPEGLRSAVVAAEAAGLDEFWVWEDVFSQSGIASAAAALGFTSRIRVGIGLMPAPLRNVALVAMEIATLDRMFPGRFLPGIGHGVQSWMGQAGVRAESPMTLLREYATALRRLLDGERVTVSGRYVQLDDVQLDWPPQTRATLLVGGAGHKTLRLSAELGDGILLTGLKPLDNVSEHIGVVRTALAELDRDSGPAPEITTTQIVATGPGAQQRVDDEAAAWDQRPGPGVGIAGGPEEVAESVRQLGELGVTAVSMTPARTETDIEGLCTVLGEARQLLHGPS